LKKEIPKNKYMSLRKEIENEIEEIKARLETLKVDLRRLTKKESEEGDIEKVKEISKYLYHKILDFPDFMIDSDAIDDLIQSIVPEDEWKEFTDQLEMVCCGALPYLSWEGSRIETLRECNEMMIAALDMADSGKEIDLWVEWNPETKTLEIEEDEDDEY